LPVLKLWTAVSLQISVRFFVPLSFKAKMMVCGDPQFKNPPTIRESPSLILPAASAADIIGFIIISYSFVSIFVVRIIAAMGFMSLQMGS
jgi:hypothetical protein